MRECRVFSRHRVCHSRDRGHHHRAHMLLTDVMGRRVLRGEHEHRYISESVLVRSTRYRARQDDR